MDVEHSPEREPPARRVNGRMWSPGESGNPHGRPIGARGRLSQRFIADLAAAREEPGATALARTAVRTVLLVFSPTYCPKT
jgi:hypothetical protein